MNVSIAGVARALGLAVVVALGGVQGCRDKGGAQLAKGPGQALRVAPGGRAAAFLLDAHPPAPTLPEDLRIGELWIAPLAADGARAGEARRVAAGVPGTTGATAFSPDGTRLACLGNFDYATGSGELWTVRSDGTGPVRAAEKVTSFAWAPEGATLAYATAGAAPRLTIESAGQPGGAVSVSGSFQSFEWEPRGKAPGMAIVARAPAAAGGQLLRVDPATGAKTALADATTDYAFAQDGALAALGAGGPKGGDRSLMVWEPGLTGAPRTLGRATAFTFAPGGAEIAMLSTAALPGDATGTLWRAPRAGGAPQRIGEKVSEWTFAASGELIAITRYDGKARAGTLVVARRGEAPRELAGLVQNVSLDALGRFVFYVQQKPSRTDFQIELFALDLRSPAAAPRRIDHGVYGYELGRDGKFLYWKSRCAGGPRSCALFRAPADGSSPPVLLASNVAGFDLSEDGRKLLLAQPHLGAPRAVDYAVVSSLAPAGDTVVSAFALEAEPGALFTDPAGTRVLWSRTVGKPQGVFLAGPFSF